MAVSTGARDLKYHPGFCNEISSEALPHALPKGQVWVLALMTSVVSETEISLSVDYRACYSAPRPVIAARCLLSELNVCICSEQPSGVSLWAVL